MNVNNIRLNRLVYNDEIGTVLYFSDMFQRF